jgi:hypothetical protein
VKWGDLVRMGILLIGFPDRFVFAADDLLTFSFARDTHFMAIDLRLIIYRLTKAKRRFS